MPRTALTPQTLFDLRSAVPTANQLDVTLAAGDVGNGNSVPCVEKQLLVFLNTDVADPYTFTLDTVPDERGREGDITTYSLAAGERAYLLVPAIGFRQTDGNLNINVSNAAVKVGVFRLPF